MALRAENIFSLFPPETISGILAVEGPILRRLADHRAGYWAIRRFTHGGLGRLGIRLARVTGLLDGRRPVELSLSLLRYFFAPYLEEERVEPQEAVFYLNRCPYGWRSGEDAALCDAVMELERQLATGIGATLIIEETIPRGAPKCRFRLTQR